MLLKKSKIISLEIKKSNWVYDTDEIIMEKRKIPLKRISTSCGRACEFDKICSFWGPNYILYGLGKIKFYKVGQSKVSENIRVCNCNNTSKFQYIFTYDIVRKYIPTGVLIRMGLYKEPKIKGKEPKNKFNIDPKISKSSKYNKQQFLGKSTTSNKCLKNYNSRKH